MLKFFLGNNKPVIVIDLFGIVVCGDDNSFDFLAFFVVLPGTMDLICTDSY
jgi:hypothetical protein